MVFLKYSTQFLVFTNYNNWVPQIFEVSTQTSFVLFFLVLGMGDERKSEKNIVDANYNHQNSQFLCQIVSYDKENSILVFLYLEIT